MQQGVLRFFKDDFVESYGNILPKLGVHINSVRSDVIDAAIQHWSLTCLRYFYIQVVELCSVWIVFNFLIWVVSVPSGFGHKTREGFPQGHVAIQCEGNYQAYLCG